MAARKKVKRFVIDVNCYVTFFVNREMDWLFQYILKNKIEVFIDHSLLVELVRVLNYPRVKKLLPLDTFAYVNFVRLISTQIQTKSFNIQGPDPDCQAHLAIDVIYSGRDAIDVPKAHL